MRGYVQLTYLTEDRDMGSSLGISGRRYVASSSYIASVSIPTDFTPFSTKYSRPLRTDATEVNAGQPGTLAAPATPTTTQTSVPGLSSTQLPSHSHSSKRVPAIVGGVIGALAFIAAAVGLMLWHARFRRRRATRLAAAAMFPAVPLKEKHTKTTDDAESVVAPRPEAF
jgi:hypothetical protein